MPKPKAKTQKRPKAPTRSKSNPTTVVATTLPQRQPIATPNAPPAPVAAPEATRPRPAARTRRATASPAQRRGADLVRFLRIHAKKPYGTRGQSALVALAKEVGHLANIELGDVGTVAEN